MILIFTLLLSIFIFVLRILNGTFSRFFLVIFLELIIKSISFFIRARIALDVNALQQVDISYRIDAL